MSHQIQEGILEVGVNANREIVINHPDLRPDENGVGHIVFSVPQALNLAALLIRKAHETATRREKTVARKVALEFAGRLHDQIHEVAALVDYHTGVEIGWAPEDAIPILADALLAFNGKQAVSK